MFCQPHGVISGWFNSGDTVFSKYNLCTLEDTISLFRSSCFSWTMYSALNHESSSSQAESSSSPWFQRPCRKDRGHVQWGVTAWHNPGNRPAPGTSSLCAGPQHLHNLKTHRHTMETNCNQKTRHHTRELWGWTKLSPENHTHDQDGSLWPRSKTEWTHSIFLHLLNCHFLSKSQDRGAWRDRSISRLVGHTNLSGLTSAELPTLH